MIDRDKRDDMNEMLYALNRPFIKPLYIETTGDILIELQDPVDDEQTQHIYLSEDGVRILNGRSWASAEKDFTICSETLNELAMMSACFAVGHEKGMHDAEEIEARRKERKEQE